MRRRTPTALTLHMHAGEPRVLDADLGERLGMARPRDIRANLIVPNRAELEGFGPLPVECTQTSGRPSNAFYLNEEQATLIIMFSRTPKAAEVRREIVQVFTAWRRGELEQAARLALPAEGVRLVSGKTCERSLIYRRAGVPPVPPNDRA